MGILGFKLSKIPKVGQNMSLKQTSVFWKFELILHMISLWNICNSTKISCENGYFEFNL